MHVQKDKRSAFGSHFEKCIFIGYPDGYMAWKFYNLEIKYTVISECADFNECLSRYIDQISYPPPSFSSSALSSYIPPLLADGLDPEELSYPQNHIKFNSGSPLSHPPTPEHFHPASS